MSGSIDFGTATLTGVVPAANVGSGMPATDGQLLIGSSADGAFHTAMLTAGSNVTITNGNGSIQISASGGGGGTVTSVSAGNGLTTGGSPITSTGTVDLLLNAGGGLSKTLGGGSNELGIAAAGVTNAMLAGSIALSNLASIADQTVLGNNSGSPGVPLALTASQTKTVLSLNNVENTALSTWAGSTNITTLGTIATGTVPAANVSGLGSLATLSSVSNANWSGTALAIGNGGTGQTGQTAAFDALSPATTTGDLTYFDGMHNVRLGVGGSTQVLGVSGGVPAWVSAASGGYSTIDTNGTPVTQRSTMNFATTFSVTDNSGASRTDIDIATNGITSAMLSGSIALGKLSGNTTVTKNSNYNVSAAGDIVTRTTFLVDTSGGHVTFTLPSPSGLTGQYFTVIDYKNAFANGNYFALAPNASEKINGTAATQHFGLTGAHIVVTTDGTDWYTSETISADSTGFTYTAATSTGSIVFSTNAPPSIAINGGSSSTATSAIGLDLATAYTASSSTQNWSPYVRWHGSSWDSGASAAKPVDMRVDMQTVSANGSAGYLLFHGGVNGADTSVLALGYAASTSKIGFFSVANAPVAQQTVTALTNNITSGGSANTLTNWTNLSTYSSDAAAIRNAVYQLGQQVIAIQTALHNYGLT
ncbi:MAG TPA: hypothetical protein VLV86_12170 [Vicinamibacterales bacterium]|nr:hypothetical protein [Vicinamibacterales bacterium]